MQRFNRAQLDARPWKNGGGVTREIISRPHGAGLDAFAWRVSIADVAADGPFSVFDGVDRVIVLLEGKGVMLRAAGDGRAIRRLDEPFVPFTFSGDDRITSSLLAGPSADFNVMTRRGAAQAEVRVVRMSDRLVASRSGVLFAARGKWTVQTMTDEATSGSVDNPLRLDAGDGCWWDAESLAWQVEANTPDAVLLAARVHT